VYENSFSNWFARLKKEVRYAAAGLNYSKLATNLHHCHLKKGNPTYVAVWREEQNDIRLVEVIYAGTHEKAPY